MATSPLHSLTRPILLDGATGTELARRGVEIDGPLWASAALQSHPHIVESVHRDYVEAGADIVTANTFRLHNRNLNTSGFAGRGHELAQTAVSLARSASREVTRVAASLAPLEDCYSPDQTPADDALVAEHGETARNLAGAEPDLLLVETHHTIREAVAACRAASRTGLPFAVSFVCRDDSALLSGQRLGDACESVLPFSPVATLLNCVTADAGARHLEVLRASLPANVEYGIYANTGRRTPSGDWEETEAVKPSHYLRCAEQWIQAGATWIGGCCGTSPAHIRALRERWPRL